MIDVALDFESNGLVSDVALLSMTQQLMFRFSTDASYFDTKEPTCYPDKKPHA